MQRSSGGSDVSTSTIALTTWLIFEERYIFFTMSIPTQEKVKRRCVNLRSLEYNVKKIQKLKCKEPT